MSKFKNAEAAVKFITAGRAVVTFRSVSTDARFTYRISAPKDGGAIRFVSLLCGSDNDRDYRYVGFVRGGRFVHGGQKSFATADAPSVKAFAWAFHHMSRGTMPEALEVFHEGRCGRCGRTLTVPESIESGFGPECINHVAA